MLITRESYCQALAERIGKDAASELSRSTVGIAGLGGLGSNIALLLARSGVGRLVIADFDKVELSNIHRQSYPLEYVGMMKTDALESEIMRVNPWCTVEKHPVKITKENVRIFRDCDIVCDAFDDSGEKVKLINSLSEMGIPVISGNGMAGDGPANSIVTKELGKNLYVCGDGVSDVKECGTLTATRVAVCAAHQAHAAIRILLGKKVTD